MRWSEIARAALRNVARRPLRNGLATLGIVLATSLLVALFSLSAGLRSGLAARVEDQPLLTMVQVTPASPVAGTSPRGLDDAGVAALRRIPGVRDAVAAVVVPATVVVNGRPAGGTLSGLSIARRAPYALMAGRAIEPSDVDAVVLTPAALRALDLDASDAVGRSLSIELRRSSPVAGPATKSLAGRVVGVAADAIPGLGIVPLPLAEDALAWVTTGESDAARDVRLAQEAASTLLVGGRIAGSDLLGSRYSSVWLITEPGGDPRAIVEAAQGLGYAAFSRDAASRTLADLFALVNAALGAISAIALLVAALGVVNALLTTVSERTLEIGVLKAIGASDGDVERLFLAEAAVVGALGGLLGLAAGWVFARVAAAAASAAVGISGLAPRSDAATFAVAMAAALLLALAAGWLPARRAARLLPATALRAE
ncbi:MAG: ABC transporter permease [Chloroflexota bacterium]|nr:ABC transporter permease [Chloroflexota bacterium]